MPTHFGDLPRPTCVPVLSGPRHHHPHVFFRRYKSPSARGESLSQNIHLWASRQKLIQISLTLVQTIQLYIKTIAHPQSTGIVPSLSVLQEHRHMELGSSSSEILPDRFPHISAQLSEPDMRDCPNLHKMTPKFYPRITHVSLRV